MKDGSISNYSGRLEFERDLWSREFTLVAGVDEAGRGPLAGPVVAATHLDGSLLTAWFLGDALL